MYSRTESAIDHANPTLNRFQSQDAAVSVAGGHDDEVDLRFDTSRDDWKSISDDMLLSKSDVGVSSMLVVNIGWTQKNAIKPGRFYDFSVEGQEVVGRITNIEWQADIDTLDCRGPGWFEPDVIGRCRITLAESLPVTTFNAEGRGLKVIDRVSDIAVGFGQGYASKIRHFQTESGTGAPGMVPV